MSKLKCHTMKYQRRNYFLTYATNACALTCRSFGMNVIQLDCCTVVSVNAAQCFKLVVPWSRSMYKPINVPQIHTNLPIEVVDLPNDDVLD